MTHLPAPHSPDHGWPIRHRDVGSQIRLNFASAGTAGIIGTLRAVSPITQDTEKVTRRITLSVDGHTIDLTIGPDGSPYNQIEVNGENRLRNK